jgi:trigger factor
VKAVVEPLEGNKVKLSIEVDEQEFERAIDAAFKKIAREVRVPGFRPGRAPRKILETRLGKEAGRSEALRDALPDYYAQALRDHDVDAIAAPEIDITAGQESGPVAFDAVVEVRPQLHLAGYDGLQVTVPDPVVSEDEITAQIDRLRGNFGELSVVDRPARDGDYLTIDLKGSRDGEPVAAMTVEDFLYELGSGGVLPELDVALQGAKPGDILAFDAELPDGPVAFQVLVKEVKEKILPDLTDEWVSEASEFDTVEALRADIVTRLGAVKRVQAMMALRSAALDSLIQLVDIEVPEPLVNAEIERRAHDLGHRLEAQGSSLAQYLQATGMGEEQLVGELRAAAEPAVKADLALRAVADAEHLDPSDEDIDREVERLAGSYNVKPEALRRELERADQMPAVRSDLRKSKALEWLIEHVDVVDDAGNPVDRALLEPEPLGSGDEPNETEQPTDPTSSPDEPE